jgi:hypothetical protein
MNQLLELASGDYIYYAAADDKVLPGFFEKSMMLLAEYSQSSLCSALEIEIDAKSRSKGWIATPVVSKQARFFSPQECHRLFQKYGIWILSPTTIYNRQALLQAGGYIPELGSICDAFVALMMANRYGVCFIPETLACFRVSNTNTSIAEYRDPNYFVKSIKYSSQLMQTTYSDLFSADHVHIWEKQWLYTLAISKLNVLGSDHRWDFALRTLSESIPIPAWINTLLSRVMQRSIQMSHSLLRFYAAARVGWLPIALRRRFSGIGLTFEENCH